MMKFEEAIKKAKEELSQAIYLSECSESKGIRTINSNKADFLSSLIYLAEIGMGRHIPEIINRQQAEIERLKTQLYLEKYTDVAKRNIESEAIKEFAERLTDKADLIKANAFDSRWAIWQDDIDNLVKEMTEVSE